MKFEIGEKVLVKRLNSEGEVTGTIHKLLYINGKLKEKNIYAVKTGLYVSNQYDEEELESLTKFNNEFEYGLLSLRIDNCLKNLTSENIELAKQLNLERIKFKQVKQ